MYTKTIIAAALAGFATAAPAPVARQTVDYFSVIAAHSTSAVHLQSINAASGKFWIGKTTASYCPIDPTLCPAGDVTAFGAASGTLGLDVSVPGGQQVYVDSTGALSFTQAHSAAIPEGSVRTGFTYTPPTESSTIGSLTFGSNGEGFFACPTEDASVYQVFVTSAGNSTTTDCIGISVLTSSFEGTAAWQYT